MKNTPDREPKTGRRNLVRYALVAAAVAVPAAVGSVAFTSWAGAEAKPTAAEARPAPPGASAAKAAVWAQADLSRQQAAYRPVRAPDVTPMKAQYVPGILPLHDGGPFSAQQFVGSNLWNGPVSGSWEVVEAGGVPGSAGNGPSTKTAGLYVYTEGTDPSAQGPETVAGVLQPANAPAGSFTITSVSGSILTLSLSGSSSQWQFDTGTRQFSGPASQ